MAGILMGAHIQHTWMYTHTPTTTHIHAHTPRMCTPHKHIPHTCIPPISTTPSVKCNCAMHAHTLACTHAHVCNRPTTHRVSLPIHQKHCSTQNQDHNNCHCNGYYADRLMAFGVSCRMQSPAFYNNDYKGCNIYYTNTHLGNVCATTPGCWVYVYMSVNTRVRMHICVRMHV